MKEFSHPQQMLGLSYIAYYGYANMGSDSKNAQRIAYKIDQALDEWLVVQGQWKRVWGPAVFALPGTQFDDALVYIVQKVNAENEFVVVVRGTNPVSIPNWVIWDFQAKELKLWPFYEGAVEGKSENDLPCLSESSYFGLNLMQTLRPPINQHQGAKTSDKKGLAKVAAVNQTILRFFYAKYQTYGGRLKITTTGHSLGGALSPLIALYLKEQRLAPLGDTNITTITFAAPTPGNDIFAAHFNKVMGNKCIRVSNDLDIVTLAWNENLMKSMEKVYLKKFPPMYPTPPVLALIMYLRYKARNKHYTHLADDSAVFPGDYQTWAQPFITQAIYQHVVSYPKLLEIEKYIEWDSWLPIDVVLAAIN